MKKPDPHEYRRDGNQITNMHGKTAKRLAAAGMLTIGKHAHMLTPKGVAWLDIPKGKRFKWDDMTVIPAREEGSPRAWKPTKPEPKVGDVVTDSLGSYVFKGYPKES